MGPGQVRVDPVTRRGQGVAAAAAAPCRPPRARWWRSPVALAVITVTAGVAATVGFAPPAAADPIGQCTTTAGVIVAVDFAAWGGNVERGCDASLTPSTTGLAALTDAGFTMAGDEQDGPLFVCRIDNEPPPAQDACIATPPADAYWSYWHADAGQNTWSYSQLGAASYHPPAGSVDAWTFGATDISGTDGQPTFPPNAVRANNTTVTSPSTTTAPTTTTPTTGTKPTPTTTASATVGPSTGPATGTSPVRPSSPTTTAASGAGHRTVPSTAATSIPPTTTPARTGSAGDSKRSLPKIVDVTPAAVGHHSAGSPVPLLIGAGAVAALAGAAGAVAWRRRRMG
jgi:hypothetical protein